MLCFDLRTLESNAVRVDGVLGPDDAVWESDDSRPTEGIHVSGRLSSAGGGKFYFSGRIEGVVAGSCRRCLTGTVASIDEELHLLFVESGVDEAEEPDVYVISAREHALDLRPAIREEWILAVPSFAVCVESCQGLCPHCGANLNEARCSCSASVDPRWSALAALRDAPR
jgi:uncharacterized protein